MKSPSLAQLSRLQAGRDHDALYIQKKLQLYLQNWYWFAISILVSFSIAFIFLRYKTPEYKISATILVKDDVKGSDMGDAVALQSLGLPSGKSNVDNEVEVLRSRALIESVVNDLQLYVQYFVKGDVKSTELYETSPLILRFLSTTRDSLKRKKVNYVFQPEGRNAFVLSGAGQSWRTAYGDTLQLPVGVAILTRTGFQIIPENTYTIRITGVEETVKNYRNALTINAVNKMVSMINLGLTDILPAKAEAILSRHITNYLANSVADKNRMADSTIAFIDQNLNLVAKELTSVEKTIESFRKTNRITDLGETSRNLISDGGRNIRERNEIDIQLKIIASLQKFLDDNPDGLVPASLLMHEISFVQLLNKYNEIQITRSNLLTSVTPVHPRIRSIDAQLVAIRENIRNSILAKKAALMITMAELGTYQSGIKSQIELVPGKERIFLDYSRQQQIKQELYIFLLKKKVETALTKSSNLANGRIIDAAKADVVPYKPSRQLTFLMAFFIGIAIPAALIYGREIFSTRIDDDLDISKNFRMPLVAKIGHKTDEMISVFQHNSRNQLAEQFRVLRTNLQFLTNLEDNVILLTSSMGGEGKSFVAINLATSLCLTGKKVILLEFDFRKPKIADYLNLKKEGITDYLISQNNIADYLQKSGTENYFNVITCGLIPPNPAELIQLPKVAELIKNLKSQYDYVILDTAPVGIVTDAQILSQYAHVTLYIMRQRFTYKHQVDDVHELYNTGRMPKINIVLNDIKNARGDGYGYHLDDNNESRIAKFIKRFRRL